MFSTSKLTGKMRLFARTWTRNRAVDLRNYCASTGERALTYLAESPERSQLEKEVEAFTRTVTSVPIVIGEEETKTGEPQSQTAPFDRQLRVATFYNADEAHIGRAIDAATGSRQRWAKADWRDRRRVFERAAELIAGPFRQKLNAATVLGQAKTTIQAELDSACALVDSIRSNCATLEELVKRSDPPDSVLKYKSMRGFWAALTSFHSTAIAGDLASAPVLMGNVALWKPSKNAILSNWTLFQVFREAGLPPGVLNFCPSGGEEFARAVARSDRLCGVNFSGCKRVFNGVWALVSANLDRYATGPPRLNGELHGTNCHFVHPSADRNSVINYTIRSAFECAGQKSAACSRLYLPESLRESVIAGIVSAAESVSVCHSVKFNAFMSSLINADAFARIAALIEYAGSRPELKILTGGRSDDSVGFYVEPTIVLCDRLDHDIMNEEIFGPVLLVHVYADDALGETLGTLEDGGTFARALAVFAKDPHFLESGLNRLSLKNLIVNDSSTSGAPVDSGSRLRRFADEQSMKINVTDLNDFKFPYMDCKSCTDKIDSL